MNLLLISVVIISSLHYENVLNPSITLNIAAYGTKANQMNETDFDKFH